MAKPDVNTVLTDTAQGGGVKLCHPRWADFENWVELRRENRAYLTPWEPEWSDQHLTRSSYRTKLARFKRMVNGDEAFPFHVFSASDGRLIGACNITHIERGVAQSAKLGYWVGERHTRQGFARASVRAATRFCFEKLKLHRVEAAVRPENAASIKVLESVGYKPEGIARGYLKIDGVWHDHQIYAKLQSDH